MQAWSLARINQTGDAPACSSGRENSLFGWSTDQITYFLKRHIEVVPYCRRRVFEGSGPIGSKMNRQALYLGLCRQGAARTYNKIDIEEKVC